MQNTPNRHWRCLFRKCVELRERNLKQLQKRLRRQELENMYLDHFKLHI